MLKPVLQIALVLALAFGGGILSLDTVLDRFGGFGRLQVGVWNAFPQAGTANADPYSRARAARKASLAIGIAEGLPFYAHRDSSGRELQRGCTYHLRGLTPAARFWTLYPATPDLTAITPRTGLQSALHSREVIYENDGRVFVTIGPDASAGNWLSVERNGPMVIVMTLYDTPAATTAGLSNLTMPELVRTKDACRD